MYQGVQQDSSSTIDGYKESHLRVLSAPLDVYWEEALIGYSDHYELMIEGVSAGYYCLNSDNQLVALFLIAEYLSHGEGAMAHIVAEHGVRQALAGTNDAYFLSLCLEISTRSEIHTILFQDNDRNACVEDQGYRFEQATAADEDRLLLHYVQSNGDMDIDSIETGFEDLRGYTQSLMRDHQIFILYEGDTLIATSECRISETQKPYADLGMIVATNSRRKGVGSYMLARTKRFCYERSVEPICSCEAGNIGSKKAITKAGFVSRDRVVLFSL